MLLPALTAEMAKLRPAQRATMRKIVARLVEGDTLRVEQVGWKTRVHVSHSGFSHVVDLGPKGRLVARDTAEDFTARAVAREAHERMIQNAVAGRDLLEGVA